MAGLIDVHVLDFQSNSKWLDQAIASLKHPEINIHVIQGEFDHSIGKARAYGFGQGTAPYCSFLDNDDYLPNDNRFIDQCLKVLEDHPELSQIYTDYFDVDKSTGKLLGRTRKPAWNPVEALTNPFTVLHWHTLRRKAVMPHLSTLAEFPTYEEFVICSLACEYGPARKVDVVGHYKRTGGISMRLGTPELLRRAVKRVTPTLMRYSKPAVPTEEEIMRKYVPCRSCLGH